MTDVNRAILRTDLLRVHVENAGHLARQRMLLTEAPHARPLDIYETDQRLAGHFRYLQLAGGMALDMAAEVFDQTPQIGEAIVFASLSMHQRQTGFATEVLDKCDVTSDGITALTEAFRHVARDAQRAAFYAWINHERAELVATAVSAATMLRLHLRDLLLPLIKDSRPAVQAAALDHAGVMGMVVHAPVALTALGHPDPALAHAAAVACLRLGHRSAAEPLVASIAAKLSPAQRRLAVEVAFPVLPADVAQQQARALLAQPDTQRWGLLALGALGSTRTLPYLVHHMAEPATARMAGWAFAMITGANVAEDDLELAEFPECDDDPLLEDAAEELFFEDGLPFPDVDRVQTWLRAKGATLQGEHPLLFGLPHWTWQDMENPDLGFQGRYRALAQLLAVQAAERPLPNWRAPLRIVGGKLVRDWQM